ncbi:hypothetical protein QQ045_000406 [Rhodiola kirilowii]
MKTKKINLLQIAKLKIFNKSTPKQKGFTEEAFEMNFSNKIIFQNHSPTSKIHDPSKKNIKGTGIGEIGKPEKIKTVQILQTLNPDILKKKGRLKFHTFLANVLNFKH